MIHAIPSQYLSLCCKSDPPSPTSWWLYIQAKLKQIAWGFFSLLSLFVGCSILFYSITAAIFKIAFFALPCFFTAGYCMWSLFRSSIYDNPAKLEAFRADAKKLPLEMLIEKHGLENIFNYAILSAEEFSKKYGETLKKMSLEVALDFYEKVAKVYQAVGAPEGYIISRSDLLRGKWKDEKENKNKTPCALLETYDLERLLRLGVLSDEMQPEYGRLLGAKNDLDPVLKTYSATLLDIEKTFQANCTPFLQTLKVELVSAQKQAQDTDRIQTIQHLLQGVRQVTQTGSSFYTRYKGKTPNSIDDLLNVNKCPSKYKEIVDNLKTFHGNISEFKTKRGKDIKKCEQWKKEQTRPINIQWSLSE